MSQYYPRECHSKPSNPQAFTDNISSAADYGTKELSTATNVRSGSPDLIRACRRPQWPSLTTSKQDSLLSPSA